MNFTNYSYQISIEAINLKTAQESQKLSEDFTQIIWQYLKNRKYNPMLVENLQVKLDTFASLLKV